MSEVGTDHLLTSRTQLAAVRALVAAADCLVGGVPVRPLHQQ